MAINIHNLKYLKDSLINWENEKLSYEDCVVIHNVLGGDLKDILLKFYKNKLYTLEEIFTEQIFQFRKPNWENGEHVEVSKFKIERNDNKIECKMDYIFHDQNKKRFVFDINSKELFEKYEFADTLQSLFDENKLEKTEIDLSFMDEMRLKGKSKEEIAFVQCTQILEILETRAGKSIPEKYLLNYYNNPKPTIEQCKILSKNHNRTYIYIFQLFGIKTYSLSEISKFTMERFQNIYEDKSGYFKKTYDKDSVSLKCYYEKEVLIKPSSNEKIFVEYKGEICEEEIIDNLQGGLLEHQRKHLDSLEWYFYGSRGSGRNSTIATLLLCKAFENIGTEFRLTRHGKDKDNVKQIIRNKFKSLNVGDQFVLNMNHNATYFSIDKKLEK